jgi:hypothetical protein
MRKAPHSQYLPDLAHSDFYLFDYVKKIMAAQSFSSADELLSVVRAILDSIENPH